MTLVAKIDGVTLPDGALLIRGAPNSSLPGGIQGLPTAAWYGEAPQGGIQLDDPEGVLDSVLTIDGLHTFTVDETACTGKERIWSGWITESSITRGPYKDGPGRVWDINIIDINWLFALEVFRASSAKRPAETDLVRVAWAIDSAPMAGTPIHDNGRANLTDNPRNFGDSDYVTKYPIELFNSITATVGKQFYAYWDHDNDEISLHYDMIGVGPTSTLAISNVIADNDSTTFYPFLDADLRRDPAWRVTGILFGYRGAYAYGRRQATIDSLSPTEFSPNEFRRDEVYTTDRVGEAATANALIETMLEERALDIHTISVSIRVPNSQVNLVEAGDLIDVKFTHLPGYEDFVTVPVIRRNVVPTDGRTDMYDIHLELRATAKAGEPGGGPGNEFPHVNTCDDTSLAVVNSEVLNFTTETLGFTPTAGNTVVLQVGERVQTDNILIDGFTAITPNIDAAADGHQPYRTRFWRRTWQTGDSTTLDITDGGSPPSTPLRVLVWEIEGENVEASYDANTHGDQGCTDPFPVTLGTVTAPGSETLLIGGFVSRLNVADAFACTFDVTSPVQVETQDVSGNSRVPMAGGYRRISGASGSYSMTADVASGGCQRGYVSAVIAFTCPASSCPDAGQQNQRPEVVTLTGANGTTLCPFADGTLHVFIDNVEQTNTLVSQDGATGDFELGFDPTPTEVCTVEYQGR